MQSKKIWIIVIIIAIVVLGVGGYALYKWKATTPHTSTQTNTGTSDTQIPPATGQTTPPTPTAHTSTDVVQTLTDPTIGQYLATSDGSTLYTYSGDSAGVSNCTGSCSSTWPPYTATSRPSAMPTNVGVMSNSNGDTQFTYKDMPLYTFASETAGQISGDGLSGFHVAKP
ncbi:MAG TPA: hypothetical protein VNG90_01740 [Candidatus Acidoferrum sp.]|nr:hypothetical protein [Candidatus Acidoferrum sp.]